tara:strand:- start:500 stop:631 length:132 start_codon:yes stop_codon:yes gene_type:complete
MQLEIDSREDRKSAKANPHQQFRCKDGTRQFQATRTLPPDVLD